MADDPGVGRFENAAGSRRVAHGNLMYLLSRGGRHFRQEAARRIEAVAGPSRVHGNQSELRTGLKNRVDTSLSPDDNGNRTTSMPEGTRYISEVGG